MRLVACVLMIAIGCGKGTENKATPAPTGAATGSGAGGTPTTGSATAPTPPAPANAPEPADVPVVVAAYTAADADVDGAYKALVTWSKGRCADVPRTVRTGTVAAAKDGQRSWFAVSCGDSKTGEWLVGVVRLDGTTPSVVGGRIVNVWGVLSKDVLLSEKRVCAKYAMISSDGVGTYNLVHCVPLAGEAEPAAAEPPSTDPLVALAALPPDPKVRDAAYAALVANSDGECAADATPTDASYRIARHRDRTVVATTCVTATNRAYIAIAFADGTPSVLLSGTQPGVKKVTIDELKATDRMLCVAFTTKRADGGTNERTFCSPL